MRGVIVLSKWFAYALLLLFIPFSSAVSISDVAATFNSEPITTISPTVPITASLYFTATQGETGIAGITVDYSSLNDHATLAPEEVMSRCGRAEDTFVCYSPVFVLHTSNATPTIQFTILLTNGSTIEQNSTLSFQIDDTQPSVTSIKTDKCIEETCYIGNGLDNRVIIQLQDTIGSFVRRNIFYSVNGVRERVFRCDDMTCWGRSSSNCNEGSNVIFTITHSSSDDAGNFVSGAPRATALCDARAPEFSSDFHIELSSGLPSQLEGFERPFVINGESSTLIFNVTEAGPAVNATIDLSNAYGSGIVGAQCQRNGDPSRNLWECSVPFTVNTESELENVRVPVTITDFVGHKTTRELTIDVLVSTEEQEPHNWDVQAVNPSTHIANRRFLQHTLKTMYLSVDVEPKGTPYTILGIQKGTCSPLIEGQGTAQDINSLEIISYYSDPKNSTILVKVQLEKGTQYDSFESTQYTCSFKVLTRKGRAIVRSYEELNATFTVNFYDRPTAGEQIQDEIKRIKEETAAQAEQLASYRKYLTAFESYCELAKTGKKVGSALAAASMILDAIPGAQGAGVKVEEAGGKIGGITAESSTLMKACNIVSCNSGYNTWGSEFLAGQLPVLNDAAKYAGAGSLNEQQEFVGNFTMTMSPYDSIITSVLMLCPTAFLYHLERKSSIECMYGECLASQVPLGVPISVCQETKQYSECIYTWGAVFNGVPLAGALRKTLTTIVETASNPVSLLTTTLLWRACGPSRSGTVGKLCKTEQGIRGFVELKSIVDRFKNDFSGFIFGASVNTQPSPCERLVTRVDNTNQYWEWAPDDKSFLDYQVQGVNCNAYNGCKETVPTGTKDDLGRDINLELNFIPSTIGRQQAAVFANGRRVTFPVKENDPSYEALKDANLIKVDGTANERINEGVNRASAYYTELMGQIDDNPQLERIANMYNEYLEDLTIYDAFEADARPEIEQHRSNERLLNSYADGTYDRIIEKSDERIEREYNDLDLVVKNRINELVDQYSLIGVSDPFAVAVEEALSMSDLNARQIRALSKIERELGSMNDAQNKIDEALTTIGESADTPEAKEKAKIQASAEETERKDLEEELKEARDAVRAKEQEVRLQEYMQQNWGSRILKWRSLLRYARAINTIGPGLSHAIWSSFSTEWNKVADSVFGFIGFEDIISAEYKMCERQITKSSQSYAVTHTSATGARPTANILGGIIKEGFGSDSTYTYRLEAYVRNHGIDETLKFRIILMPGNKEVQNTHSLTRNTEYRKSSVNALMISNLQEEYEQVCIVFENDDLQRWFTPAPNNNRLCSRLVWI